MKRIAGIFLAALLVLTVLPHGAELVTSDDVTKGIVTTAYAEENTITISSDTTWDENCEYFVRATSLGGMDYIKLPGNLVVNSGATLTVSATVYLAGDATISGSGTIKRGADFGGAMFRIENRTLTIEGNVTFDGSSSGDVYRSVIEIPSRGVVNLKSGTICNNNISYNGYDTNMIGGGVWVGATGTLNMTGGTITGNEASYGGGVYAYGTINMSGGEIKNNTARVDGGGAYISDYNGSVFQVSKTATIKGNYKAGTDNNVYLEENRKIEVVEALTGTAEIVLNNDDPSSCIVNYNASSVNYRLDGNTLKATETYEVSFNGNGSGEDSYPRHLMASVRVGKNGNYTVPGEAYFDAPYGKRFAGWATSPNGEVCDTIQVTSDTVLYAKWENVDNDDDVTNNKYTVRIFVENPEHGSVSVTKLENVPHGAVLGRGESGEIVIGGQSVTITPEAGYYSAVGYTNSDTIDRDKTITVTFYEYNPGGEETGGEVTPGTGTTPRYYYNSTAAADTKADGSKTGSPKTFDAGVGIYAVSAVLSLTGMAYVGKKKF